MDSIWQQRRENSGRLRFDTRFTGCVRWCLLIGGHYGASWERRRGGKLQRDIKSDAHENETAARCCSPTSRFRLLKPARLLSEVPAFLLVSASQTPGASPLSGVVVGAGGGSREGQKRSNITSPTSDHRAEPTAELAVGVGAGSHGRIIAVRLEC